MTEQDAPVDIDTWDDADDGGPSFYVSVTIGHGTVNNTASVMLTGEQPEEEAAAAVVRAVLAAASMRGMDFWMVLQRALTDYGTTGEGPREP